MNSVIVFCAQYLFIFVILALVLAWFQVAKENKFKFIIATVIAGGIALVLSRIAGKLYYDPRPFVTEHVKPLIKHIADNGFPSDHALLTGTLTAITYFFNKKVANVMLVLTLIIGIARILAKVHSPLDIAGGWVFGAVAAVAAYYLVAWIFRTYKNKAQSSKAKNT